MDRESSSPIVIAPDLMSTLAHYAQQAHKTVSAVTEEALRTYLELDPRANEIRRQHIERAAALGLDFEVYIARMMKEWRREDREAELRLASGS